MFFKIYKLIYLKYLMGLNFMNKDIYLYFVMYMFWFLLKENKCVNFCIIVFKCNLYKLEILKIGGKSYLIIKGLYI